MIQIWKPKHSATVIRLDSVFAHGDGLPAAGLELRQTVWTMQVLAIGMGLGGFKRYRLFPTLENSPRFDQTQATVPDALLGRGSTQRHVNLRPPISSQVHRGTLLEGTVRIRHSGMKIHPA